MPSTKAALVRAAEGRKGDQDTLRFSRTGTASSNVGMAHSGGVNSVARQFCVLPCQCEDLVETFKF